jgi:hypothetical protein
MGDTPQSMRAVQSSLRDEIVAQRQEDEAAHAVILGKLHDFETELRVRNARDEEKLASGTSIKKQLFALIILFLSILTGLVSWFTLEIRETQENVSENSAHFREFQAIGIRWGDDIDARAEHMQEDIRHIRRLMNEHQRNNKKHVR